MMTVRVTPNLNIRIKLLRAENNRLQSKKANGYKLEFAEVVEYQQQLKECKRLMKNELVSADIGSMLQ